MSQYLELETEETVRHGEDDDAEIQYEEMLLKAGAITEEETVEGQAKLAARKSVEQQTSMQMIICSCGSPKCYMIRHFGLPKPTFQEHIEPVFPQYSRDIKAAKMKDEAACN